MKDIKSIFSNINDALYRLYVNVSYCIGKFTGNKYHDLDSVGHILFHENSFVSFYQLLTEIVWVAIKGGN